jgi:hypothetical protein
VDQLCHLPAETLQQMRAPARQEDLLLYRKICVMCGPGAAGEGG